MKKFFKRLSVLLFTLSMAVYGMIGYFSYRLPNHIMVDENSNEIQIREYGNLSVTALQSVASVNRTANSHYKAKVNLLGLFPVGIVDVYVTKENVVTVLGVPFGMKIYTDGVMIVDFTDVQTKTKTVNPCKEAGICAGDVIVAVNGEKVYENRRVVAIIKENQNKPIDFLIRRGQTEKHYTVTPVADQQGEYKIGIWIRDSTAGIGTLTFCDKQGVAAGLGHGICDVDTGDLVEVLSGEFVEAEILSVQKGNKGFPGELKGVFRSRELGKIVSNQTTGIYGLAGNISSPYSYAVAPKQEIESGSAKILTTVDQNGPCFYDCEIKRINFNDESLTQNFIVEITDPLLIEKTGGIVQGMSGSPIIQNGKLIGAVTHVLVDDPTKGYGIFAENMLETAQSVSQQQLKDAS
ncbi:MAG: SpoIVB peptidase [Clostridia bacterium]|nr:SpoIVB peptidase [Clostridia bacterium]MBQ7289254.1 SpoIVB peptidase [Clostridia bacterium]